MRKHFLSLLIIIITAPAFAQKVDYSVVAVDEEIGLELTRISSDNDYVYMPIVKRSGEKVNWLTNRVINITPDGRKIAYIAERNNTTNIYVKDLNTPGVSIKRTNRRAILDFSFSPDGKFICFCEGNGNNNVIFQTEAENGHVCRQITSGSLDYSPIYSTDMKRIFFTRQENNYLSIWSYDLESNYLSTYSEGYNPQPLAIDNNSLIYVRTNGGDKSEIWRLNYDSGIEECILSDTEKSFTSPIVSPDGKWILCVGNSKISTPKFDYYNTDIYACRTDGTNLIQLTYHAADDLSPIWSLDGKYIYFISQRGSSSGSANIWKMKFNY